MTDTVSWELLGVYCTFDFFKFMLLRHARLFPGENQGYRAAILLVGALGQLFGLGYLVAFGAIASWAGAGLLFGCGVVAGLALGLLILVVPDGVLAAIGLGVVPVGAVLLVWLFP